MSQQEETKHESTQGPEQAQQELIIEQVRSELETYFAPQNIQNDFNLRQKMTTDGYIDINLLLDLKLLNELVSSRELLIEAISRSKLLVMNTGCTMVKYMPILERDTLIIRDVPASANKAQIAALFDNDALQTPTEIRSEIGGHWFCRFDSEEHCLEAHNFLAKYGQLDGRPLHVRVKAVHDKNKADTSPQMANSPKAKSPKARAQAKGGPQNPPPGPTPYGPAVPSAYSPGQWYAYYGTGVGAMDPYAAQPYGGYAVHGQPAPQPQPSARRQQRRSKAAASKDSRSNGAKQPQAAAAPAAAITPPPAAVAGAPVATEDETTLVSDYPGAFDKYPMETFLEIFAQMKEADDLEIPQSMRGRDFRIISDDALMPVALAPKEAEQEPDSFDEDDDHKARGRGRGRARGRGRGRGRGRDRDRRRGRGRGRRGRKEVSGTYYAEDVFRSDAQMYYDGGDARGYYYDDGMGAPGPDDAAYYYNERAYDVEPEQGYYDDERGPERYYSEEQEEDGRDEEREYAGGGGGGGGRRRRRNGRSRGQYNGGGREYNSRRGNRRRESPKGTRQRPEQERRSPKAGKRKRRGPVAAQWTQKQPPQPEVAPVPQYSTNRGVYRPKAQAAH